VVYDDTDHVLETGQVHEDLDIGEEQVSSNECWDAVEDAELIALDYTEPESPIHADLDLGDEQVTSNECYEVEEE
jgi:hypothetical protein